MPKKYTPEEKAHVIARAAEIGAAAAAREAGVNYNSVLNWMHAGKESIKSGMELTMAYLPWRGIISQNRYRIKILTILLLNVLR